MPNQHSPGPRRTRPVVVYLTEDEHKRASREVELRRARGEPKARCSVVAVLRDGIPQT